MDGRGNSQIECELWVFLGTQLMNYGQNPQKAGSAAKIYIPEVKDTEIDAKWKRIDAH